MKKSRVLLLAALAAAATINVSCSDKDEVLESGSKAKSNALIVNASLNEGSRATALTKGAFEGFTVFGFTNPSSGDPEGILNGTDGLRYSGNFTSNTWTVPSVDLAKAVWPTVTDNSTPTYNFYALSLQGNSDLDLANSGLNIANLKNGVFGYTMPTDITNQKDIMVARCLAKSKGETGIVDLPFKHALANLTIQIRYNFKEYDANQSDLVSTGPTTSGAIAAIGYIAIHNVHVSGNYSFVDGDGTWTVNGDKQTIKYVFNTPPTFVAGETGDAEHPFVVQDLLVGDKSIMMVPQELTNWVYTSGENGYHLATQETEGAFVEVHMAAWKIDYVSDPSVMVWDANDPGDYDPVVIDESNKSASNSNGEYKYMASVYYPLNKIGEFKANHNYNLRLNLLKGRQDNGEAFILGVTLDE